MSLVALGEFAEISVLEVIDLTDNYIGELTHVKHLSKFAKLRSVAFQKAGDASKGANPICDFVNYRDTVQMYLPALAILDGVHISEQAVGNSLQSPKSVPTPAGQFSAFPS